MRNPLAYRSNLCKLTKKQMRYVQTIYIIVQDCKRFPQRMTKILDHLYLGNFQNAKDVQSLKQEGITHIINTVDDSHIDFVTKKEYYGDDFEYLGFTSDDNPSYPIMQHFDEVNQFIEQARAKGGKCLIHCMAGINRSGCLATAHVMMHESIGPISAASKVFEARGALLTNGGFIERLVKFAVDNDLLQRDKDLLTPSDNKKSCRIS